MKKKISLSLLFLLVISMVLPLGVSADNPMIIDLLKENKLTVTFCNETVKFDNIDVSIYLVAEYDKNANLNVNSDFVSCQVDFSKIKTNSDYDALSVALLGFVNSASVKAVSSKKTDKDGVCVFDSLKCGFYLVSASGYSTDEGTYSFMPFMVSVPSKDDGGAWIYEAEAIPKTEYTEKEKTEYSIIILWDDGGNEDIRPESIEVVIYKDGEEFDTVVIGKDNGWTYSWKDDGSGAIWTFAEKNLPEGYTVTQYTDGTSYKIVNTLKSQPQHKTDPPKTGDYFNVYFYTALGSFAGISLIAVSLFISNKKHNEE